MKNNCIIVHSDYLNDDIAFICAIVLSRKLAIVHTSHHEAAMVQSVASRMVLSGLIPLIQNGDFADLRKRDMVSAVRAVGRVLGADLSEIDLDPPRLRARLETVSPAAVGMTPARWNNIRSLLGKALELARPMQPSRSVAPLLPAWEALMAKLPENRRVRLLAMVRHLSTLGVGPDVVCLVDLVAYHQAIVNDRLRGNPEGTWEGNIWAWNASVREIEGWPAFEIPRENKRTTYVQEWSVFPASLKAEVDRWKLRQSGADLSDDEGPNKPLRASSLKTREYHLRAAASNLLIMGIDPSEICTLADIVRLDRFKLVLKCLLDRNGQKVTAQVSQMASFLKSVADHWVNVDDRDLVAMKRLISRLSQDRGGMTRKNRERLRPFDDPAVVQTYLGLPEKIRATVEKDKRPPKVKAVAAQMAAAIAILQAAPIRVKNLTQLDVRKNMIQRGDRLYLVVEADDVKNSSQIDIELPPETVDILVWYTRTYRPHLLRQPNDALFPGEGAGPKSVNGFGAQISKAIFKFTGLKFNPHLARHAAAKIYLDSNPGQYEIVRLLLGHKSMETTLRAYAGAEQASASRHFHAEIDKLRAPKPVVAKRGRKPARALLLEGVR